MFLEVVLFAFMLILDRVGSITEFDNGEGTFVDKNVIFASIVGTIQQRTTESSLIVLEITNRWKTNCICKTFAYSSRS